MYLVYYINKKFFQYKYKDFNNYLRTGLNRKQAKRRTSPAPKPKWAKREAQEEIEMYLNDQVAAFQEHVFAHVPHYIIEQFLHR